MKSLLLILLVANCLYGYAGYSRVNAAFAAAERPAAFTPLDVPAIRLLSERPAVPAAAAVAEVEEIAGSDGTLRQCQALGPFDDLDSVERVKSQIEAEGGAARIVEANAQAPSGFLVYVGPAESATEARVIRDRLVERSVDCHIIATGELTHALSVGVFDREELALRQSRRVAALGFQTHVTPLLRSVPSYHLLTDAEQPQTAPLVAGDCAAIAPDERFL